MVTLFGGKIRVRVLVLEWNREFPLAKAYPSEILRNKVSSKLSKHCTEIFVKDGENFIVKVATKSPNRAVDRHSILGTGMKERE